MITINVRDSKKCNGDYSLFISFGYDEKIVNIIRELPDRYWDTKTKEWEVPSKKLSYLIDNLSNYEITINTPIIKDEPMHEVPANFEFKTKPFKHQIEGFNYGLNNDRWLLGDEQGLGKTKQVIDIAMAKKLERGYSHCLIICGINGLKWNWYSEIETHSNETGWILGQRRRGNKVIVDGNKAKLDDLQHLDDLPYFIITNVESLRNEPILKKLVSLCNTGKINMIAADEVHKMKNPSSQQGKAFLKLQTETMIAMTGTPLMNQPLDLYIILKWLGYEKHTFYAFKNHYCVMGGFGGYEIVGYRYLSELQEELNGLMLRRLKDEVLDLPEKTHINEYVEMSKKQWDIYKEVQADIVSNIDKIKMANNPLSELIRLRQATGYTGILSSTIQESAKLDRMEELVADAVENGKKVVIFSNWTQMTDVIYKRLYKKYGTRIITGDISEYERKTAVNEFQHVKDVKVLIGTIGAMGTGLTLTAGTVEIFMDEPWNKALKDQAEDRCHRVGTTQNVTIYTLMCKDTIDERIHQIVENKGFMADAIVDGETPSKNSELLDFLLS